MGLSVILLSCPTPGSEPSNVARRGVLGASARCQLNAERQKSFVPAAARSTPGFPSTIAATTGSERCRQNARWGEKGASVKGTSATRERKQHVNRTKRLGMRCLMNLCGGKCVRLWSGEPTRTFWSVPCKTAGRSSPEIGMRNLRVGRPPNTQVNGYPASPAAQPVGRRESSLPDGSLLFCFDRLISLLAVARSPLAPPSRACFLNALRRVQGSSPGSQPVRQPGVRPPACPESQPVRQPEFRPSACGLRCASEPHVSA
jgi:hypothetical protein